MGRSSSVMISLIELCMSLFPPRHGRCNLLAMWALTQFGRPFDSHHFAMCKQPSRLSLSKTVVCENDRRHPTTSRAQFTLKQ
jgi:hypothetical protein